jgi:hypothetical protein
MFAVLTCWCAGSVALGDRRSRFPDSVTIDRTMAQLAKADARARAKMLPRFLRSVLRPITGDDNVALSSVGWRIGRLYQQSDDDDVLDAVLAAGFDTEAATTMFGRLAGFLEQDPAFVRRHPKAAKFIWSERGGPIVHAPIRVPSLEAAEKHCQESDSRGWGRGRRQQGYLQAATEPSARVSVDGKDTDLSTPIGIDDEVFLGPGKHRVSFTTPDRTVDVEGALLPTHDACVYGVLKE